jgi:hypothetical protein
VRRIVAASANGAPGNIEVASIRGLRDGLSSAGFPVLNLTPRFAQNMSRVDDLACRLVTLPIDAFDHRFFEAAS